LLHYSPIWIALLINVFVIFAIVNTLSKLIKNLPSSDPSEMRKMRTRYRFVVFQTLMFVLGGIIIWTPGTILRIWQYTSPDQEAPATLVFFLSLITPSQGFMNFLIYTCPLLAQTCCFFILKKGRREKMEDSMDLQALSKIQPQTEPIIVGRSPVRSADYLQTSPNIRPLGSVQTFYRSDTYTLFANEEHRSIAELISSQTSTTTSRLSKTITATRTEPVYNTNRLAGVPLSKVRDADKQRSHYEL